MMGEMDESGEHERMEGGEEEMNPRLAAIQELLKFLRQSEAGAVPKPQPEMPRPEQPAEAQQEGELSPEALEALKSLMG